MNIPHAVLGVGVESTEWNCGHEAMDQTKERTVASTTGELVECKFNLTRRRASQRPGDEVRRRILDDGMERDAMGCMGRWRAPGGWRTAPKEIGSSP